MKQKFLKLGMLAFTALMLTYCQREELGEEQPEEPIAAVDPQTVVSLEEAKSLFEASEAQKQSANSTSRSSRPLIELDADWRYFVQTKTRVGSAYSKIPITIADSDLNAEMLFLKENGVVTQYLFITEVDSLTNDNRIVNADFYLFTPKGDFISAHRMTDGVISHKLVPKIKGAYRLVVTPKTSQTARIWPWKKKKKNKAGSNKPQKTANHIEKDDSGGNNDDLEDDDFDYDEDAIQLEEVVVYGSGSGSGHYNPYPTYGNFGYGYSYGDYNGNTGGYNNDGGGSNDGYKNDEDTNSYEDSKSSDVGVGMIIQKKQDKLEKEPFTTPKIRSITIQNKDDYPCLANVITKIGELNTDKKILVPYIGNNNVMAAYIKNLFGNSPDIHIDFSVQNLGYGYENGKTKTLKKGERYGIAISHDLLAGGSELFIAKTVIHEMLHAYFKMELDKNGLENGMGDFISDFKKIQQFPNASGSHTEHEMMAVMYIDVLAASLAAYDKWAQDISYYKRLAWSGLEFTNEYRNLPEQEKIEIIKIAKYEREENRNTICN